MNGKSNWGCIIGGIIGTVAVLLIAGFWLHSATTTRRVDPGNYGVVIFYHSDGSKDAHIYDAGYQYTVEWGSNVKNFEYPSSVQTIKIYRSTKEGIAPYPDDIYCHDKNGVQFSGDVQAHFMVARNDVYTVYAQHPDLALNGAVDDSIAGVVVRPVLQEAWQAACTARTYQDFQSQEYTSVEQDILNYAKPLLKAQGVTLVDVGPQTVYLPGSLQTAINNIAQANAALQASQIAIQTAKNQASALEEYNREIAKNPALLRLLLLEKVLEKWDGHGVLPSYLTTP